MTNTNSTRRPKLSATQIATRERLIAEATSALAATRRESTRETREAAVQASRALNQWLAVNDPPKCCGYASRAGKRQQQMRRAIDRLR